MLNKIEKQIMIRTSFRGTHNWPEASQYAGDEVQFLEDRHRHTFHILAELTVSDSDREVEFFVFQNQVDLAIRSLYSSYREAELVYNLGRRSCETMAEEIISQLRSANGHHHTIKIEVWEDNEVGGRVTSFKDRTL
jgi:hypothetical protein